MSEELARRLPLADRALRHPVGRHVAAACADQPAPDELKHMGGRLGDLLGLRPTLAGYGLALGLYAVYGIVRLDSLRIFDRNSDTSAAVPATIS